MSCAVCPRRCNADRARRAGVCGMTDTPELAVFSGRPFMLHKFEEPVISGERGTAALFFRGCNLGCVYCQNADISAKSMPAQNTPGERPDIDRLAALMEEAAGYGETLSLITAAHFVVPVSAALEKAKPRIRVPVVYNSSGYETAEALKRLEGLVDVYLPDFKYLDPSRAARYSAAPDYPDTAKRALAEMTRQQPSPVVREGILRAGVLVRHLVLPGGKADGVAVMRYLAANHPRVLVSVMRQYTPEFCPDAYPELRRRVTTYEYEAVLNEAARLGLKGFGQERGSATTEYTPDFRSG